MSIHISCYTKYSPYELQGKLNNLSEKYSDLFPLHYYLSSAVVPHPIQKEISNEFGLDPCSYFIMSVNNKALEMSTDGIANVIRNELGKENVIMLLNGERLVECLGDLHNTYELEVILNLINIEDEDLFVTRIDSLRYLNLSLLSKSKREQFLSQVKPLSEKSSAPIKKTLEEFIKKYS